MNEHSTITVTDFTNYLDSPLRQYARAAIAARRTRLQDPASASPAALEDADATGMASAPPAIPEFDAPTADQFQTLDVADAIGRCIDQVGWDRFRILVTLVASARGEE